MTDEEIKKLVSGYRPIQKVLDQMAEIQVFGTVGSSASGKTTLMNELVKKSSEFELILDETSRAPRPNEQDGVDFLFRTKEEILQNLQDGELVQLAIGPNNDLYSTRLSSYPQKATGVIALVPPAVKEIRHLPIKSFTAAFIVPESFETWQSWLAKQAKAGNWTDEKLRSRLVEAEQSYTFALSDDEIYFVLNDKLDKATRRLLQAAHNKRPDDEVRAKETAQKNYAKLVKLLRQVKYL